MCRTIRWLLLAFLVVEAGCFILSWAADGPLTFGAFRMQIDPDGMAPGAVQQLGHLQKVLGILVGIPGLAALTYGIRHLDATLACIEANKIFAAETIAHLRTAAGATICAIVLFSLEQPLRGLAFILAPGGQRHAVSFDITSNELLLLLVCSMFYLVVGVMHEGRRLREENEGFI